MNIKTTQEQKKQLETTYQIPYLPLSIDLETKTVLKKAKDARAALAELKGVAKSMPNQAILVSTLSLQEAKDSSAIENIITTNDDLYTSDINTKHFTSIAAKEVHMYACALRESYAQVKKTKLLTNKLIKNTQSTLEGNTAGFRSQGGTALKNDQTHEVIYVPPQRLCDIEKHMKNLEDFINHEDICDWDPLVKMAVAHHQFESIHPFFDGNGRTGRIINILYLVQQELLDTPILYLSRYINHNKNDYYRLLQSVRDAQTWEEWVLFILDGVKNTSLQTIKLIEEMKRLMQRHKNTMRAYPKNIYSQDLLNLVFSHPYTKIAHAIDCLNITRPTATRYLDTLVKLELMHKTKVGRDNYYINLDLMNCLSNVHDL